MSNSPALKAGLLSLLQVSLMLGLFLSSLEKFSEQAGRQPLLDFVSVYAGGRLFLEQPQDLYDAESQRRLQKEVFALPLRDDDFLAFPYPPFIAAYVAMPALLSYRAAYRLFIVLNLVALALIVYLLASRLSLSRGQCRRLSLLLLPSLPLYVTLAQGQLSLFFALVTTGFWLSALTSEWSGAFAWGALLTGKPTLTSGPILQTLLKRRWGTVAGWVAATALLWCAPLLWTGRGILSDYLDMAQKMSSGEYTVLSSMCGLRGLDVWLGGGHSVLLVLASLLILGAVWRARNWDLDSWGCCSLILATLLLAPHLYVHDLVLLLPVLGLLLHANPGMRPAGFYGLFLFSLIPLLTFLWGGQIGLEPPFLSLPMAALFFYTMSRWKRTQTGGEVAEESAAQGSGQAPIRLDP